MKVLELKPLKNKKLKLILLESEFPIEWWLNPTKSQIEESVKTDFISKDYMKLIEDMIKEHGIKFVAEEQGMRSSDKTYKDDALVEMFRAYGIPYQMVDISENALGYLESALDNNLDLLKGVRKEFENIKIKGNIEPNDLYFQQLYTWKEYLEDELRKNENEIKYKVREAWMMMGIMEIAKKMEGTNLKGLLICDKSHFEGIASLAEELVVDLEKFEIKKNILRMNDIKDPLSIKEFVKVSAMELAPIKIKKKINLEKIIYFFDTDEHVSPFDINMAYDAGFDVVIPVGNVRAEQVPKLVQDAIFSRKPKAPTCFFIGGSNVEESEKIAKNVIKSLVPPFEVPVIIDPRGSHTTAASVVAKTIDIARKHRINDISGKKIVILGTGPVGRIAAIIAAKLGCKTILVETWEERTKESVNKLVKELNKKTDENASVIVGEFAIDDDKKYELLIFQYVFFRSQSLSPHIIRYLNNLIKWEIKVKNF